MTSLMVTGATLAHIQLLSPLMAAPLSNTKIENPREWNAVKTGFDKNNYYYDLAKLYSQYVSWGVDPSNPASVNVPEAWKHFSPKKEIVVAVVDTGIDRNHPFLEKNIHVAEGKLSDHNYGMDFTKEKVIKTAPRDLQGHGSHVAGIIKSIYPEVKILPLKFYAESANGVENLNSEIEALRYAVDQNVDIINYSGGGPVPSQDELRILKEAERKGIIIVTASGNYESNIDSPAKSYYPASYGLKNLIAVTAHDEDLKLLPSSNYGKASVDIAAPGQRIKSALNNGRIGYLTGTSQATAFVTGVVALMKAQHPKLPLEKYKEIITKSAKKEKHLEGKCASNGRLDAGKALILTKQLAGETQSNARDIAQTPTKEGKIIYRLKN